MNQKIDSYFFSDTKNNCTKFIGDKLEIFINKRYEAFGLLNLTDTLECIGIFDMVINDDIEAGICLSAMLHSIPSQTYNTTIDEKPYLVAVYNKNDVFISNMNVIKNDKLGYILWNEFIALGNLPKFITYDNISLLFDLIGEVCGIDFGVNHAVFEMVYSHLFRDPDNISQKYRLTDMKKRPIFVPLRNVSYGPDTTAAKIMGSYFADGLNSALVNESDKTSEIDHILFGINKP